MKIWIALLRGINVGGRNPLPMAALREQLEAAGLRDVRTVIQSGNVVFGSNARSAPALAGRIATAIEDSFGMRPAVLVLEARELAAALDHDPLAGQDLDPAKLHLFFLEEPPRAPDLDAIAAARAPSESFALEGRVFYLAAPDGIGRSKLASNVERWLGVATTARNARTLRRLVELAGPG